MDSDRNLLVGMAALQSGLISPVQFAEAATQWMSNRAQPLIEVLVAKGWISDDGRSTLEARVHDLEVSTVVAGAAAGGSGNGHGGSGIVAIDDSQPTRSWDPDASNDFTAEGLEEVLAAGFGPRYINAVLHATSGMGQVWRALDTILGREVAIKNIRPKSAQLPHRKSTTTRFLEEARISSQLQHPNIVPVHDLVEWSLPQFYTMRFLGNTTLKTALQMYHGHGDAIEAKKWTLRRLLEAFIAVCNAIAFAHDEGVIHRDIKGQNVILGEYGEVIMLDWGLAKRLDSAEDPLAEPIPDTLIAPDRSMSCGTAKGQAIGTPNYMAPEQAYGDHDVIGKRTDVFGLGAMLYQILTGRAPYEGGDVVDVLRLAREGTPVTPRSLDAKIPAALESICLTAMERDPAGRYPDVKSLAEDVRHWLDDEPVSVHNDGPIVKVGRWTRRHQPLVAGVGALLITALAGLAIGTWRLSLETEKLIHEQQQTEFARKEAVKNVEDGVTAVRRMLEVVYNELPGTQLPATDKIRRSFTKTAASLVQKVAGSHPKEESVRMALSDVSLQAAHIHRLAYQFDEADKAYHEAIRNLTDPDKVSPGPASAKVRDRKATIHQRLAESMALRGNAQLALDELSKGMKLVEGLRKEDPKNPFTLCKEAEFLLDQGDFTKQVGNLPEALKLIQRSIKEFDEVATLGQIVPFRELLRAVTVYAYGLALFESGDLTAANSALMDSEARLKTLLQTDKDDVNLLLVLAKNDRARARVSEQTPGGRDEAMNRYRAAIGALESIKTNRPDVLVYREELAITLTFRGEYLAEMGAVEKAMSDFAAAVDNFDFLLKNAPATAVARGELARSLIDQAQLDLKRNDRDEANRRLVQAESELAKALAANGLHPWHLATQKAAKALKTELSAAPVKP